MNDTRRDHGTIVRNMIKSDLGKVVEIHMKAFPEFFLSLLGRKFLYILYENFMDDHSSICLVAIKFKVIEGFVIGNIKPHHLFRKLLLRKGHLFFFYSLKAFISQPLQVSKKLLYALRYRGEHPADYRQPALLSSLAVDPSKMAQGVGRQLVSEFCREAFLNKADAVYLTTDKLNNDAVNAFYLKNGFHLLDVLEQINKRKMNRYIKFPDEKDL